MSICTLGTTYRSGGVEAWIGNTSAEVTVVISLHEALLLRCTPWLGEVLDCARCTCS